MDNSADDVGFPVDYSTLSYDNTLAYEEQVPPSIDPEPPSLANRIGHTKVYLLSESSAARVGKRKLGDDEESLDDGIEMEDEDPSYRGNALLFHGPPISHLPTTRLFAYVTHFDAHPMGLEWIDDTTAIFVFASKTATRLAYQYLKKSVEEDADFEGFVTAKPIPIAFWPPEERINQSLGKGEGLKGTIRMRWAKHDDVKKKGAKKDSEFYKKHGSNAGKEMYSEREQRPQKRRRDDEETQRARLDDDLDEFLAQDASVETITPPPSPPSKMRSDYIGTDGRTLLERTSTIRVHPNLLSSRITAPLPRRRIDGRRRSERDGTRQPVQRDGVAEWLRNGSEGRKSGDKERVRREERPRKSQQELDDELDAFLNDRD